MLLRRFSEQSQGHSESRVKVTLGSRANATLFGSQTTGRRTINWAFSERVQKYIRKIDFGRECMNNCQQLVHLYLQNM